MTLRAPLTYAGTQGRDRPFYNLAVRAGRTLASERVNPAPYYSYTMSMYARVAVYKALCACDVESPFNDWFNLSYATDRGIVFG